jgi:serine protease AprX
MYSFVCMGSWRWPRAITTALVSLAAVALVAIAFVAASQGGATTGVAALGDGPSPVLASTAERHPAKNVEVIVQLGQGADADAAQKLVSAAGGEVTRELNLINGFGAEMRADKAVELAGSSLVRTVTVNAPVMKTGTVVPANLATAYNQSIRTPKVWADGYTGKGVGVAVVDTGIAGDMPDFRVSQSDTTSRVVATAVVNPAAQKVGDSYGHGTHIAGLIAGNGTNRPAGDPLYGKYAGVAPDANLIDVKAADEDGNSTVLDVIDGLQFVVDHKSDYNIRVVNLSLRSTVAQSYKTDPLDAAVEQAWNSGIVVVAAAGNNGSAADAVSYAPANDPYVITVGAVDDMSTKDISDDKLTSWSSRGKTQDGLSKPDVVAPGARLVSTMGPNTKYRGLCPTCVVDGDYFRVGGTSMSAGLVSGEAATLIQRHPDWTPNQIKGTLVKRTRAVVETVSTMASGTLVDADGGALPTGITVDTTITNAEIAADKAHDAPSAIDSNANLVSNSLIDTATGLIDFTRASWSRASWSTATDALRASWSRASWSRASWSRASWSATPLSCSDFERASWSRASWSDADIAQAQADCATITPTRASWSATPKSCTDFERASWSRASWSDVDIAQAKIECTAMDPTRASWSGAEYARASWSSSFDK